MKGFELEPGTFFMCTEASPRCFVIQQVNDVDNALKGVHNASSSYPGEQLDQDDKRDNSNPPSLPMLPWWFTNECKQQLLNIPSFEAAATGMERVPTPDPSLQMTAEQVKARLKIQLEYYFSRENLINDRYLRCQMDADQFVPIKIVAGFPKIAQLTTDFNLIVQILKESEHVQVDDMGEKVRPNSKRCTIILREIPKNADENVVKAMFEGCPQKYESIIYGLNGSWYITFATEEDTRLAFIHLQNLGKTFNDKPVHARIKTGGAPVTTTESTSGQIIIHDQYLGSSKNNCDMDYFNTQADTTNSSYNLGQILARFGYVPRCTFRPSTTMKDSRGGLSINVPISIHTDWHSVEIEQECSLKQVSAEPQSPPSTQFTAQELIGYEGTKENVQPISHYSITTTSTTSNTTKKLILDYSTSKAAASVVQQTGYDGFLLTNTSISNYDIPNFGRQRITDVPRMKFMNKNYMESHYSDTRNCPNNHSSAGFFDNKSYRHRNSNTNCQQERSQLICNSDLNSVQHKNMASQPINVNTSSHCKSNTDGSNTRNHQPWKQQYSRSSTRAIAVRHNSYGINSYYNRSQQGVANSNSNWRKMQANTRVSLDNYSTESAENNKPPGFDKPLSTTIPLSHPRALANSNTTGLQSLTRCLDSIYHHSKDKKSCKSEGANFAIITKLEKSTQPNECDLERQKRKSECSEECNSKELEYNFVEVEFPSLVEDENLKKSVSKDIPFLPQPDIQNIEKCIHVGQSAEAEVKEALPEKHTNIPVITKETKAQFSAIVAGKKPQPFGALATQQDDGFLTTARCSYAQTLKKHASK